MTDDFSQDIKEATGGHELSCQEPCEHTVDTGLAGESRHQSSWGKRKDRLPETNQHSRPAKGLSFKYVALLLLLCMHMCVHTRVHAHSHTVKEERRDRERKRLREGQREGKGDGGGKRGQREGKGEGGGM